VTHAPHAELHDVRDSIAHIAFGESTIVDDSTGSSRLHTGAGDVVIVGSLSCCAAKRCRQSQARPSEYRANGLELRSSQARC
jgi:hypothetical protein